MTEPVADSSDHPARSPAAPSRRGRRALGWTLAVLVALGVFVWFIPSMLSAAWMKSTVLTWLNQSPDHRIDFAGLDLTWTDGLKLSDVRVDDLRSPGEASFFTAGAVAVDVQWRPLLDKSIVVDEFTVRDAVLDLRKSSPDAAPPSQKPVSLPEGTFGLSSARVPVHLKDVVVKMAKGDIRIDDATMLVRIEGGELLVDPIEADVNDGKVTGTARIGLEGATPSHKLELHAKGVQLDEYMAPVAAHVMPMLAGEASDGKTTGNADFDLTVTASGRRVEELKRSLRGEGGAGLTDMVVEARTWITQLLTAAGQPSDRIEFDPMRLPFQIADNRVVMSETDIVSKQLLMRLGGHVTLDGELDYRLRVKPSGQLAAVQKYAKWLDPDGYIPFHLTGSVASPGVSLPGGEELIANALKQSGLEERAKTAIDDLLTKKTKPKPDEKPAPVVPPKQPAPPTETVPPTEQPPVEQPPTDPPAPERPKRKPRK